MGKSNQTKDLTTLSYAHMKELFHLLTSIFFTFCRLSGFKQANPAYTLVSK